MSALNFALQASPQASHFGPRIGKLRFKRFSEPQPPDIPTPALITTTSRGIVPHLSQDHVKLTGAIQWAQVHFETFLEQVPPVPTQQKSAHPLHKFLGYQPDKHIISLSLRDPSDGQEMPPNTKDFVTCKCVRGVRKMTPSAWSAYILACKPDVVTALADIPPTSTLYSQKRIIKSLQRSTEWLADLLRSIQASRSQVRPSTLVSMVGGNNARARRIFAEGLVETLSGKDLEYVKPLMCLDEGVDGYICDLVPLRMQLDTSIVEEPSDSEYSKDVPDLLKASLSPLPATKLRIAHSSRSPHEILLLIQAIGIDLFDARFAQDAANLGVALDFTFPTVRTSAEHAHNIRTDGKINLGHNLFSAMYAHDHSRLAGSFIGVASSDEAGKNSSPPVCPCAACSPRTLLSWTQNSTVDARPPIAHDYQPSFTRAYIHHLLHTHEMSSHTLLAMHNLSVMDAFFTGVRDVLSTPNGFASFDGEVARFCALYDESMAILDEAKAEWAAVERARGKGRLKRENPTDGGTSQNADV
ncbi:tRNA-guanine transglycosylase [Trametopsis cervina]|nr:tRNA-guanine transglycosylase [Trametopsis cervina]